MQRDAAIEALRALVDRYRARCLWFLREDYYPATPDEIERVLRWITTYGDTTALQEAARVRQWLSPHSSETSDAS